MQSVIELGGTEDQGYHDSLKVVGWVVGIVGLCDMFSVFTRQYVINVNNMLAVLKVAFLVTTAIIGIEYGTLPSNQCRSISWETRSDHWGSSVGDGILATLFALYACSGFDQPFYVLI